MNAQTPSSSSSRTAARRRSSATRHGELGGHARRRRPRHGADRACVHHRDALWVASAMTDEDARGQPRARRRRLRLSTSTRHELPRPPRGQRPRGLRPLLQRRRQPDALVHPALPLGPLQRAGHPRARGGRLRARLPAGERRPGAARCSRRSTGRRRGRDAPRLPPLHWRRGRSARATRTPSSTTSSTSRGRSRTPGACCRADIREDIYEGILSNDIIAFHTDSLQAQLPALLPRAVRPRGRRGGRRSCTSTGRDVWVRAYPLPISAETLRAHRPAPGGARSTSSEILRRRREHLILRVDRADLSKNVLRGFTAFDLFLDQHPEFREKVTFIAHLMPSRQDVPEYVEYLEKIEALVAVVNHRHGTTDWMPIDLQLRENLDEAIAAYKHYDLLMVNAMFDGMNLIAKEGPLVNERDGVIAPVREHRRARGAGRVRALGQPVRRAGAGRRDPPRAHHVARGALVARRGPQADRHRARPGRLDRRPAHRHRGQARRLAAAAPVAQRHVRAALEHPAR